MIPTSRLLLATLLAGALSSLHAADPDPICNRVRFQAYPGGEQDLVGAVVEGSNVSRSEGYTRLATVKEAPAARTWGEIKFDNSKIYRWVRVSMPRGAKGRLVKLELYHDDQVIAGAEDGRLFHPFLKDAVDDGALGYDLGESATARRPSMRPTELDLDKPTDVTLTTPTKGAVIRYTLDGFWPTAEHGEVYAGPIHVTKNTTISSAAFLEGRASSLLTTNTYLMRDSIKPGLNSAHLGNSLTGTTLGFPRFARTAGYNHQSVSFLRGGALTRELWALASGEYAQDEKAVLKEKVNRKKGSMPWEEFWPKVGKIDLLTFQPRDFDLDKEIAAEVNFLKLFRQKSPDLQPWLYCEWVELKRERPSDRGEVPTNQMTKTFPALSWEESMSAMLLYVEELQVRLAKAYPEGKRAHIIPAALAMGWMKNKIDHGQIPGVPPGTFYPLLFNDQVHPAASPGHGSANGAYLVDMTWHSAFYREAPEGKVLPIETSFTPEQARIVARLAWEVVKNYPDCGLYEQGTEPCGKPEFANDGKTITLKSATDGAWFRYTLDGTTPTRTRGYVYCGRITVQPGIQVKAIAYKSGMVDSPVAEVK
jgi:hypothetical protein